MRFVGKYRKIKGYVLVELAADGVSRIVFGNVSYANHTLYERISVICFIERQFIVASAYISVCRISCVFIDSISTFHTGEHNL